MKIRTARLLAYVAIAALLVGIVYALQAQSSSQANKIMEAGLIESGKTPMVYFKLTNTRENSSVYTYLVSYNSTKTQTSNYTSSVTIPPGQTFSYSIALTRPIVGVMFVRLTIYNGAQPIPEDLVYQQQWSVRSSI